MEDILLSWSGGKDCSMALHELRRKGELEVVAILTTVTEGYERISMHGVRKMLLNEQAESLGLPLEMIRIPQNSDNLQYESRMKETLEKYLKKGMKRVAFGDLFLEDVRSYREDRLGEIEMSAVFPLWRKDTKKLAHSFISSGFRAVVCCVDTRKLEVGFCGREFDEDFLRSLPADVDPCGENGEFHTFAYDGPIFSEAINVVKGEKVLRDDFCFIDLLPSSNAGGDTAFPPVTHN